MDATHSAHTAARPAHRRRRPVQVLLAVAGLATVLTASGCDTAQQVPWASYSSGLQVQIDAAAVRGNCAGSLALIWRETGEPPVPLCVPGFITVTA